MVRKRKKIDVVEPPRQISPTEARDQQTNAVINIDNDAYMARIRQKNDINKQKASTNRIDMLEIKIFRLERKLKELEGK